MAKGICIGTTSISETLTTFSSKPTPINWQVVTQYAKYVAENDWGIWTCESSSAKPLSSAYYPFDGILEDPQGDTVSSGEWGVNIKDVNGHENVAIYTPENISIKPTSIKVIHRQVATGKLQGLNENTEEWEDLKALTPNGLNKTTETFNFSGSVYYKGFRVVVDYRETGTIFIHEIEIISGTKKQKNINKNVPKPVKKSYIGVDNKARKIRKGYIGVGGVARLFYSLETLVPFTSSPIPTSWTDSSDYKSATATNSYGEWYVGANTITDNPSLYRASYAFDGSTSTYYVAAYLSSDTTGTNLQINLPTGVSIKPSTISVRHRYCGNSSRPALIRGYDGTKWVDLATMGSYSSAQTETFTIEGDSYYTKFLINLYRYSSNRDTPYVYGFDITSGTLKIE